MTDLTIRTEKTSKKYEKLRSKRDWGNACNLCKKEKSIKEFKYWIIIKNRFPWDRVARISHMIMPKRHVDFKGLTIAEKKEYEKIKLNYLNEKYDMIAEATDKRKSIPGHFHIHLLVLRKTPKNK